MTKSTKNYDYYRKNNKLVIENAALLNNWTEYYEDLYNYKFRSDNNLLKKNTMNNNEELLILECEVCDAIQTLKNVKSPGLYNIPSELLKHGGESLIIIFTTLYQEIWKTMHKITYTKM